MIPFRPQTAYGQLVINGYNCHNWMLCALDIRSLMHPTAYKGENSDRPGYPGRVDYEYLVDESDHVIPCYFTPVVNSSGAEYASRFLGWETNMAEITTNLLTPPVGTASFSGVINTVGGNVLTAKVQVKGFEVGGFEDAVKSPYVWRAALGLKLPEGLFRAV